MRQPGKDVMQRGIIWNFVRLNYPRGSWSGLIPLTAVPKEDIANPFYRAALNQQAFNIEARIKQVSAEPRLFRAIRDQTYFNHAFDDWHITDLVRRLNLTGFDLFYALVKDASPTGFGWCNHQSQDEATYRKLFEEQAQDEATSVYFDYVNGIRMKNRFPIDVQKDESIINIRRYEGGCPITRIVELVAPKLELPILPATGC